MRKSLGQIYLLIRIEEREHPVVPVLIVRYTPHLSSEFEDTRIIFQHVVFLKIEFAHEIRGVGRSHIFFVPPEIIEQQRIFDIQRDDRSELRHLGQHAPRVIGYDGYIVAREIAPGTGMVSLRGGIECTPIERPAPKPVGTFEVEVVVRFDLFPKVDVAADSSASQAVVRNPFRPVSVEIESQAIAHVVVFPVIVHVVKDDFVMFHLVVEGNGRAHTCTFVLRLSELKIFRHDETFVHHLDRFLDARPGSIHAVFGVVVAVIAPADQHAETSLRGVRVGEEAPAELQFADVVQFPREVVESHPEVSLDAELVRSRGRGSQVDVSAHRIAVHIGRQCFGDLDGTELVCGNQIERFGSRSALLYRRELLAVDADVGEMLRRTAYGDGGTLAFVAGDVDPGQSLQCLRHVLIGKLSDEVGRNDVLDVVRSPLLVERPLLAFEAAHDHHFGQHLVCRRQTNRHHLMMVGRHVHGFFFGLVPQIGKGKHGFSAFQTGQTEMPFQIGGRTVVIGLIVHRCSGKRLLRIGIDNDPPYLIGLSLYRHSCDQKAKGRNCKK